jgi:hypothetical protein
MGIVRLRQLGELLRARYPEEWKERRAEVKAKQDRLKEKAFMQLMGSYP